MKKIKIWLKELLKGKCEGGVSLVEIVVAIAILGGGAISMVLAISGGAMAVQVNDQSATAQSLARSQLEYIKSCAYDENATTYPTITAPDGYGISVGVSMVPGANQNIQKVTANVTRDSDLIMTVTDYKMNR